MIQLRDYQTRTVEHLYAWLENNPGNPCVELPTGAGKSVVIAHICRDLLTNYPSMRVLMLTHVRELIDQNARKLLELWPGAPLGIYSAGLGRRELGQPITFAGIQSVRTRAEQLGVIDVVMVDECHLINHAETGGYRQLIAELTVINPNLRVIGFTASPYRLGHGLITDKPAIFDDLISPVTIEELIAKGHLAPLRSKFTGFQYDLSRVHQRGGEYVEGELQSAVDSYDNNDAIADEIINRAGDRRSWLLFCTGVDHAAHMAEVLMSKGVRAACITGDTPAGMRKTILDGFKAGSIRAVTNANVLTTGFDFPGIDLLAFLRPTKSPSLYVQMAGRGLRVKPHTDHCLALDFAGVVSEHGPITAVRTPKKGEKGEGEAPAKNCPQCGEIILATARECPVCGYVFEVVKEPVKLHQEDIMGRDRSETEPVISWRWKTQNSKNGGTPMLVVDYYTPSLTISEYLCVKHGGYAQDKSERLLGAICKRAGVKAPSLDSLNEAADYLTGVTAPTEITYEKDDKFYRVTRREWPKLPEVAKTPIAELPEAWREYTKEAVAEILTNDDVPF
jgi:DNA repair protein RadD